MKLGQIYVKKNLSPQKLNFEVKKLKISPKI